VQFYIFRLVDHTHPAAADLLEDEVVGYDLFHHGATPCYARY
jgi:hypothetical protein